MFHATMPSPDRKLGGVEVYVQRLAHHLSARGVRCTVYSLDPARPDWNFEQVQLFPRLRGFFHRKLPRWLVLPAALNFAPWRRHDVLVLFGDDWFFLKRPAPSYRVFSGSGLFESRTATSLRRKAMQRLIHHFERFSSKICDASGALAQGTASLLGCRDLVDIGIDPLVHRSGDRSATPRLLFVGTWEGRKQGNVAWKIFTEQILPRHPDAILDFVSDRPPPSDHPSVRFHRFPSDEDLAALFRQAWVFLYPSTYEGYGIPYLEALASGTPVVCLPNEGTQRLLVGCPAAFVRDSPQEMAESAVEILTRGPDAYRDRSVEWTIPYRWDAVVDRYLDILGKFHHA